MLLAMATSLPVGGTGFTRVTPTPDQPLEMGIWYPSEASVPAEPNTPFGQALAFDSEPLGNDLPLVILSHGNAGWMGSHADTALALAEAGYVAVAITHADDNAKNEGVSPSVWMVSRPAEVVWSIDYVRQEWSGAEHVSAEQTGVFGFSAGGYTALVAAAAVPDIDLAVQYCDSHPAEFLCVIGLVEEVSNNDPGANLAEFAGDPRIKALSIAAPAFGFAFDAEALEAVDMPVQIWSGSLDERVPHDSNGALVAAALSGESEVELVNGAGHFAFLAPCNPELESSNPQIWQMVCQDASEFDRVAFHKLFDKKIVSFFNKALAQ